MNRLLIPKFIIKDRYYIYGMQNELFKGSEERFNNNQIKGYFLVLICNHINFQKNLSTIFIKNIDQNLLLRFFEKS